MIFKTEIEYIDTDNKKVKEFIARIQIKTGYTDYHIILFLNCTRKNKKIKKYRDNGYVFHEWGTMTDLGKTVKYVSIEKQLSLMSKNEREQVEGKMIMFKLTQ
jgi:hypothetical protein